MNVRRLATDVFLAVALVVGISVVIGAAESVSHVSNISNVYVIGVAILASRRGLGPAMVASILAFVAFDWFFIPPIHEFVVNEPSEYVALLTLLATSVIISQLLAVAHRRAGEALRSQHQTQLLYDVSEAVLSSRDTTSVYPLALWRLNDALQLVGSRLYLKNGNGLRQVASSGTVQPEDAWIHQVGIDGRALAVWKQSHNDVRITTDVGSGDPSPSTDFGQLQQLYLPLRIESRVHGPLLVGARKDGTPISSADQQLLVAFANQLAVAVERQNLTEHQARAPSRRVTGSSRRWCRPSRTSSKHR